MVEQEKIFTPATIEDNPLPNMEGEVSFDTTQSTSNETFTAKTTKEQPFPTRKIAHEVLGQALNTRSKKILAEFEFTQQGALQIGKYENGVSGDLRISPNGIVARDSAGLTTFALDGTTGSAVFKGEIQSGTLVTGLVSVGNNNVIIDGENNRIVIYDDSGLARILIGYQESGF